MDHLPLSDIPMLVSSINFLLRDEIYIQSWLKALKNDNRMIVWAAKKAEEAARYIMDDVTNNDEKS